MLKNLALTSKDNMSGADYIKRIVGKGGDRIILDVEKKCFNDCSWQRWQTL